MHPEWFIRYTWGFFCFAQCGHFCFEQQYGITRKRNNNYLWPWWLQQQAKIRSGEIPKDTPGYYLVAWNNDWEKTQMERFDEGARLPNDYVDWHDLYPDTLPPGTRLPDPLKYPRPKGKMHHDSLMGKGGI